MRCQILVIATCAALVALQGAASADSDGRFVVQGTLFTLPRSRVCVGRTVRVTARYRVERVEAGAPATVGPGRSLLVVHDCPRHARGHGATTSGSAPWMKVGDRHRLTLRALPGDRRSPAGVERVDPFAAELPRYRALITDLAPYPARMVVTARGGAGTNHRVTFDRHRIVVGSGAKADLRLFAPAVAPLHLSLVVEGDKVVVRPAAGQSVRLDGEPLTRPGPITHRNKIGVGPYTLEVSLLTEPWYDRR